MKKIATFLFVAMAVWTSNVSAQYTSTYGNVGGLNFNSYSYSYPGTGYSSTYGNVGGTSFNSYSYRYGWPRD